MMEKVKTILFLLAVFSIIGTRLCYAQPEIPKENIPSNIPSEVEKHILRLYSSDAIERASAVFSLGELGKKAVPAIPFLIAIFIDSHPLVEDQPGLFRNAKPLDIFKTTCGAEATKALIKIGNPAIEPLITALKDKDDFIRGYAAATLGGLRVSRAVNLLISALKDEKEFVRMNAALALREISDPHAVMPLIAALKDKNIVVQAHAASALGEFKDPRSVKPLIDALDNKSLANVLYALIKITGKNFGKDRKKWREWWEQNKENYLKGR